MWNCLNAASSTHLSRYSHNRNVCMYCEAAKYRVIQLTLYWCVISWDVYSLCAPIHWMAAISVVVPQVVFAHGRVYTVLTFLAYRFEFCFHCQGWQMQNFQCSYVVCSLFIMMTLANNSMDQKQYLTNFWFFSNFWNAIFVFVNKTVLFLVLTVKTLIRYLLNRFEIEWGKLNSNQTNKLFTAKYYDCWWYFSVVCLKLKLEIRCQESMMSSFWRFWKLSVFVQAKTNNET